jgi:hypothetical protein
MPAGYEDALKRVLKAYPQFRIARMTPLVCPVSDEETEKRKSRYYNSGVRLFVMWPSKSRPYKVDDILLPVQVVNTECCNELPDTEGKIQLLFNDEYGHYLPVYSDKEIP